MPRPKTMPAPRLKKKKQVTPGPGSYDLDSGMGAIGRPSASSASVPKFSIGTADRFAYMGQYVSKRHAKSSSYFGKQSPGPATYNTRGGTNQKGLVSVSDTSGRTPPSYSFGGDVNRPSPFRSSLSPGPVYYPQMGSSSSRAKDTNRSYQAPASYSMGSGHTSVDATTVVSPGPVYDTRHTPGQGDATKAGLPTYKFGTSKSRTDYSGAGKTPGPGEYGAPGLDSSKHRPPRYTMSETYGWRTKKGKKKPAKQPGPAANLVHESLVKEGTVHGGPNTSVKFGMDGRWEED